MKLYFDHIAGVQTDTDFIHCLVSATFDRFEYDWALSNGWSPSNIWYDNDTNFMRDHNMVWYQSRQTRINLLKYESGTKEEKKTRKRADGVQTEILTQPDLSDLYSIYQSYVSYRNFDDSMTQEEFIRSYDDDNLIFILFAEAGQKWCAFSVLEEVGNSLIAHQFCWDYASPKLYLGKFATFVEIEYARNKMYEALYMGPSYQSNSRYKTSFPGFEWWTGREWSTNKEVFIQCLENDDKVRTIDDLVAFYQPYFQSLSV